MYHAMCLCVNIGYLNDVDTLLRLKAAGLCPRDRVVVISFDEVYVKQDLSYDQQADQFIGPHKSANTMLLRGLCKNYKVCVSQKGIYFNF